MDDAFRSEIARLMTSGRKIEAIKLYRERTGASLAEAKSNVEAMDAGLTYEGLSEAEEDAPLDPTTVKEIVDLLERGEAVRAIKHYREVTGRKLSQSKEAVDRIAVEYGIARPGSSGCLGIVLAIIGLGTLTSAVLAG